MEAAFTILSLLVIVAAWRVVTTQNVVRAALALVVVLAGMAPLFIMLAAEFVAVIQVLVYVGAVVVLFLFGIMLTRSPTDVPEDPDNRRRWPGLIVAVGLFGALWFSLTDAFGNTSVDPKRVSDTADVGSNLLRENVIAFEAVSVLLLAALIGAIVLARQD